MGSVVVALPAWRHEDKEVGGARGVGTVAVGPAATASTSDRSAAKGVGADVLWVLGTWPGGPRAAST
jgi:hypothetical protein